MLFGKCKERRRIKELEDTVSDLREMLFMLARHHKLRFELNYDKEYQPKFLLKPVPKPVHGRKVKPA